MTRQTIGFRIKQAREVRNLTQQELAKAVGVSRPTISMWETGQIRSLKADNLLELAKTLKVELDWIRTGKGVMELSELEPGPDVTAVPLISWIQAGHWNDVQDNYRVGDGERQVYAQKRVGSRAYALRVIGDSMSPRFPPGCIIIVDPDKVAEHGNPVIVRLEDTNEATFKLLMFDGGRRYLKPINPAYPTLELNRKAVITGVVIQMFMDID